VLRISSREEKKNEIGAEGKERRKNERTSK
jgi:hypothetical protein